MKICFVVNDCNFFYTHRFALAKKLTTAAEVYVITDIDHTDSKVLKSIRSSEIKIFPIKKRNNNKKFFGLFAYLFRLLKTINKVNPQNIFFVTLEISLMGAILNFLNPRYNSYYLITGFGPFFFKRNLKNKILYLINKVIFLALSKKRNNKFIFQNQEDKDIFINEKIAINSNSILIPGSGVEIDKIKFLKRTYNKKISFLIAARLVKSKGIKEFVYAAKLIKSKYPSAIFNIAGEYNPNDPDRITKELFFEIKNSNAVNYLGNIPHHRMQEVYLNSDIFVLPSYGEGLPKAALEAAASGMPLILSKASGCKECLDNEVNGLLVEIADVDNLKIAIEKMLLDRKLISEMSTASRKKINMKFSINKILNYYKNLLALAE